MFLVDIRGIGFLAFEIPPEWKCETDVTLPLEIVYSKMYNEIQMCIGYKKV